MKRWIEIAPGLELLKKIAYQDYLPGQVCPPEDLVFRSLELTTPENIKVVILGQDPYHAPGKANGLAFGYHPDWSKEPDSSLLNIEKELGTGLADKSLESWARQGVLLLNTCLTVETDKPGSHDRLGWQLEILDVLKVVKLINYDAVWLSFGSKAKDLITELRPVHVIHTSHPCKFSHNRGRTPFTGSQCFERVNDILTSNGKEPIKW